MKKLWNDYWFAILLLGMFGLLVGVNIITSCNKKVVKPNEDIRQIVIDSLNAISATQKINAIDSTNAVRYAEISKLNSQIKQLKSNYQSTVVEYKKDTVCSGCCEPIIEACNQLTDSLDKEVLICNQLSFDLEQKTDLQDTLISIKEKAIGTKNEQIEILEKELKKKSNWWNDNKFYIGFGLGFTTFILLNQ